MEQTVMLHFLGNINWQWFVLYKIDAADPQLSVNLVALKELL